MVRQGLFKISRAARLNEYSLTFERWETTHEFKPFLELNPSRREPLTWYYAYNEVKHGRYGWTDMHYACAIRRRYVSCWFPRIWNKNINEGIVETPMFTIKAPHFPDEEQYGFIWVYRQTKTL